MGIFFCDAQGHACHVLFQGALRKLPNTGGKKIDYAKLASVVVNYGTAWMALTRKGLIKEG